ncbi:MAG: hydrogenase maturation nickel metallochaperone HypA [Phycisphaerae bacterium]|nr:hydrogenase maturation nickel metallochaperone HypA [Phycisphaerae bacterium]
MHEFAVARMIVEQVQKAAEEVGASRVTSVLVRVGVLRQIEASLLAEAFTLCAEGTCCSASNLEVEISHVHTKCKSCDSSFEVLEWVWSCPRCGAEGVYGVGGDELQIVSIDAEIPDEVQCAAKCV